MTAHHMTVAFCDHFDCNAKVMTAHTTLAKARAEMTKLHGWSNRKSSSIILDFCEAHTNVEIRRPS